MADAGRATRDGLKVLFIAGYAETAALGSCRLDRGGHVMTKPFAMKALATRVRSLLLSAPYGNRLEHRPAPGHVTRGFVTCD